MDLRMTAIFNSFYEHIVALKLPITANSVEAIAKRLILLGFINWDESTATTAKLLSLGLANFDHIISPLSKLILEKGDWGIHTVIDDKYNNILVKNLSKNLTLVYPSPATIYKYKEFQVNPIQANRDTDLVLKDVKAIINNISGN